MYDHDDWSTIQSSANLPVSPGVDLDLVCFRDFLPALQLGNPLSVHYTRLFRYMYDQGWTAA